MFFLGGTGSDNAVSFTLSNDMDALEAVRPSMFADINQRRLFTADIVWFEVV